MADIGAELLEKIRKDFKEHTDYIFSTTDIKTMENASEITCLLGKKLAESIRRNVTADVLPDNRLYYNIADTILNGILKDNYNLVNQIAEQAQLNADKELGINLAVQKAEFPEKRVQAVVNAVSDKELETETAVRRMAEPAENITKSFFTDFTEKNADFRHNVGLETYIVRKADGKCCEWCNSVAGKYPYPRKNIPEEVFRRHDGCGCSIFYVNGREVQKIQNEKRRKKSK